MRRLTAPLLGALDLHEIKQGFGCGGNVNSLLGEDMKDSLESTHPLLRVRAHGQHSQLALGTHLSLAPENR